MSALAEWSIGSTGVLAAVACLLTVVLVPPLRALAVRTDFVDHPAVRKHHQAATPLLGGVALMIGIFLPPLALAGQSGRYTILAAGAALLMITGLIDDRRGLGVAVKLSVQALVASALVVSSVAQPPEILAFNPLLSASVTILWLVGITNAFNLLDNVDGLSASVASAAALGILAVGGTGLPLAACVFGATLGFLVFNWAPARIFMGDAGSLPLGLTVAVLVLDLTGQRAGPVPWLLPALLLAVPIADTMTVFVSRIRRGRNPLTTPGTDHLSHRLVRSGLGVPGAVTVLVLIALAANVVAWWLAHPGL